MQQNPRVGLVLMRSNWSGCGETQEMADNFIVDKIQDGAQAIDERLRLHFDISGSWVVDSQETLQACQHGLRETDLDMILVAYQTWAEDTLLISLLQAIGSRPLVIWCYSPWQRLPRLATYTEVLSGSGPVGTFAALGTLRNLGTPFLFTFGSPDDPRLIHDLRVAGRAAQLRSGLRKARFGLLPSRNDQMQCTFVDEYRLMSDLGPVVEYITIEEYQRAAGSITGGRVADYLRAIEQRYPVKDVSPETLERAARAALGLERLATDRHLDVLSVNNAAPGLRQALQLTPGLYPLLPDPALESAAQPSGRGGSLDEAGDDKPDSIHQDPSRRILYQPAGDLGAATAGYILNRLTGSPVQLLELWFWDEARNTLIGGYGGLVDPALGEANQVWVGPEYDACHPQGRDGAQFQLVARPGRVTMFQLRSTPKGWQAMAASGICLEERPWVEGCPHAILRLDVTIERFLNRAAEVGTTPHWVIAYGSVLHEVEAFCQLENIPLERLTY